VNKIAITGLAVLLIASVGALRAEDFPQLPLPQKEHKFLEQFVGEWETEINMPGKGAVKANGIEIARMLGGFWVVGDGKSELMGMPFTSVLTLGYDPQKKKYVGTWVDSVSSYLWKYEGTLDSTGKILTLDTEGPCPLRPGELVKFKEVTEFKSKDHRIFKSSILGEDGKWTTMVTVESKRKKK